MAELTWRPLVSRIAREETVRPEFHRLPDNRERWPIFSAGDMPEPDSWPEYEVCVTYRFAIRIHWQPSPARMLVWKIAGCCTLVRRLTRHPK